MLARRGACDAIAWTVNAVLGWVWQWLDWASRTFSTWMTAAVYSLAETALATLKAALGSTADKRVTTTQTDKEVKIGNLTMEATSLMPAAEEGVYNDALPMLSLEAKDMKGVKISEAATAVAATITGAIKGGLSAVSSFAGSAIQTLEAFCTFSSAFYDLFFADKRGRQVAFCQMGNAAKSFLVNLVSVGVGVAITVATAGLGALPLIVASNAAKAALLAGTAALTKATTFDCSKIEETMKDTTATDTVVVENIKERINDISDKRRAINDAINRQVHVCMKSKGPACDTCKAAIQDDLITKTGTWPLDVRQQAVGVALSIALGADKFNDEVWRDGLGDLNRNHKKPTHQTINDKLPFWCGKICDPPVVTPWWLVQPEKSEK